MNSKFNTLFLSFMLLGNVMTVWAVNTTLNVNAIANEVLPDTPVEYVYHGNGYDNGLKIQKIKTGRKDMAGNDEVYLLMIVKVVNDTFYLVPDNHVYPLFFREFRNNFKIEVDSDGYRLGNSTGGYHYLMAQAKFATIMWDGTDYAFVQNHDKKNTERGYLRIQLAEDFELLKSESAKLWESIDSYYAKLLADIKGKKYDDMMSKFDGKKIVLQRSQSSGIGSNNLSDIPKITFNRDENGNLKELVLWYSFIDGKYYDKPEFKKTITKAANGLFFVTNDNEALTGNLNGYFIPYSEGFLIISDPVIEQYGFGTVPECDISAAGILNVWDMELFNIQKDGLLFFSEEVHNILGGVFYDDILKQYYMDWWKTKYIEMSYQRSKDKRNIKIWLPEYLKAVVETAK